MALVSWDGEFSYTELERKVGTLAAALQQRGVGCGGVVAVYMPRSAAAIIALLGVMRSGAAYTVVEDDGNITENLARLRDIAPQTVIAHSAATVLVAQTMLDVLAYEDALVPSYPAPSTQPGPGEVAYVLYTSGSTGRSRGVAVTHANLRHYVESLVRRLGIDRPLRYAHVSALSADLGNTSLLLSLWTGGTLHVVDDAIRRDGFAFREYARDHGIQFLKITPSHFQALFPVTGDESPARHVFEYLVLGGEIFPASLAREVLDSRVANTLVNHYGPTETTIGVTVHVMRGMADVEALRSESVPIGRPFGETRACVLTARGTFRDWGAEGELYIGGPSVALGYIGDPRSTEERFVSDVKGDMRFYRTGDLCRVDDEGVFEFLRRLDRQVKVNGYRVELDHVSGVLCRYPEVRAAQTFYLPVGGRSQVVAAYLPVSGSTDGETMRRWLQNCLPAYMVPARLVPFEVFPLNANGKVDMVLLQDHMAAALSSGGTDEAGQGTAVSIDDPVHRDVMNVWQMHLRHGRFEPQDSFFAVGGDSISAIQVISSLQVRGYRITPAAFLREPTVRGIVEAMRTGVAQAAAPLRPLLTHSTEFSPAQELFFQQEFAEPDHWVQSIALDSAGGVNERVLERALNAVLALHPALRCAYRRTETGWEASVLANPPFPCLTVEQLNLSGERDIAAAVRHASERLSNAISLARGEIFKAHLVKAREGRDTLLLLCHHLSVDAVSWRILISDLVRFYGAYARGLRVDAPAAATGYWEWVHHVRRHRALLEPDLAYWRDQKASYSEYPPGRNCEEDAVSLWIHFSAEEMDQLTRGLLMRLNVQPHAALLGAFAHAFGHVIGAEHLRVDVESHGRAALGEELDISRVVGWFTSTFPVELALGGHDAAASIVAAREALESVPKLGIAFGELLARRADAPPRGSVCYNYLGEFHFQPDDLLQLSPSLHRLAPARGPRNDRVHDLKLTARTIDGRMAVDLSFSRARHDVSRMRRLLHEAREALLRAAGMSCVRGMGSESLLLDSGSTSGLLTYVPRALHSYGAMPCLRRHETVLLTGATGFVGVHVLHELLQQTDAHVICLVRAGDPASAAVRLNDVYCNYMGDRLSPRRVTAVPGDVAAPKLGLPDDTFRELAGGVDAIYHFAADTRLFGPAERFDLQNVEAVRSLIELARSRRGKALHHMSTLAVAGIVSGPERVFSELCLDIGQEFQNEYERSKYRAEELVFRFKAEGGTGYIYRSGNVSSRLSDGRFQRNASENRFIQFLRAVCKIGKLPRTVGEAVALSPVDVVARAIVRLSLNPRLNGGVFHVDTTHVVPFMTIVDRLRAHGFSFQATSAKSFRELFEEQDGVSDPELSLGLFWASRPMRNVRFSHDYTSRLLNGLECGFPSPDPVWVGQYVDRLVEEAVLRPTGSSIGAGAIHAAP